MTYDELPGINYLEQGSSMLITATKEQWENQREDVLSALDMQYTMYKESRFNTYEGPYKVLIREQEDGSYLVGWYAHVPIEDMKKELR